MRRVVSAGSLTEPESSGGLRPPPSSLRSAKHSVSCVLPARFPQLTRPRPLEAPISAQGSVFCVHGGAVNCSSLILICTFILQSYPNLVALDGRPPRPPLHKRSGSASSAVKCSALPPLDALAHTGMHGISDAGHFLFSDVQLEVSSLYAREAAANEDEQPRRGFP